MEISAPVSGKCLCGAIQFEVTGPCPDSAHCHCSYCRRAHGAAFVTWVVVPEAYFKLTTGEENLRWYHSSKQSQRGFCERCGSTLFFRSTLCPGETHVTRAAIIGESAYIPEPKYHCFVNEQVPWIEIRDSLVRLDENSSELSKYLQVEDGPGA